MPKRKQLSVDSAMVNWVIVTLLNQEILSSRVLKMKRIMWSVVIVLFVFSAQPALALSVNENLGSWRKASTSAKKSLCKKISRGVNESGVNTTNLYRCISETAGDGGLDHMKILDVATACALMLRN